MTLTLRERRRQMLRDEILQAARELLAAKGYAAMRMDELATQVGISKPTLYTYFPHKEALVVEAATWDMRQVVALIEGYSEERTPLERLTLTMRELLQRQMRAHSMGVGPMPEIFRLLCENPDALACIRRIDAEIVAQVAAAIASGEVDAGLDAAAVVRAFYGLASALPRARFSSLQPEDPGALVDAMVEIFTRGVRAR